MGKLILNASPNSANVPNKVFTGEVISTNSSFKKNATSNKPTVTEWANGLAIAANPIMGIVDSALNCVSSMTTSITSTIATIQVSKEETKQIQSNCNVQIQQYKEETNRVQIQETEVTARQLNEINGNIELQKMELIKFKLELEKNENEFNANMELRKEKLKLLRCTVETLLATHNTLLENFTETGIVSQDFANSRTELVQIALKLVDV